MVLAMAVGTEEVVWSSSASSSPSASSISMASSSSLESMGITLVSPLIGLPLTLILLGTGVAFVPPFSTFITLDLHLGIESHFFCGSLFMRLVELRIPFHQFVLYIRSRYFVSAKLFIILNPLFNGLPRGMIDPISAFVLAWGQLEKDI